MHQKLAHDNQGIAKGFEPHELEPFGVRRAGDPQESFSGFYRLFYEYCKQKHFSAYRFKVNYEMSKCDIVEIAIISPENI